MTRPNKNTPEGKKAIERYKQTILARYGSEEAVKEYYRTIGSKGGKLGTTGGWYGDSDRASRDGRKGGTISSRAKVKPSLKQRRKEYAKKHNIIGDKL